MLKRALHVPWPRVTQYIVYSLLVIAVLSQGVAHGEFIRIEDFERLELGPIDGQNSWTAISSTS